MEAAVGYGLERGMTLMTWACEGPRVFISLWGSLTRVKMDAHTCAHTDYVRIVDTLAR